MVIAVVATEMARLLCNEGMGPVQRVMLRSRTRWRTGIRFSRWTHLTSAEVEGPRTEVGRMVLTTAEAQMTSMTATGGVPVAAAATAQTLSAPLTAQVAAGVDGGRALQLPF